MQCLMIGFLFGFSSCKFLFFGCLFFLEDEGLVMHRAGFHLLPAIVWQWWSLNHSVNLLLSTFTVLTES